MLHSWFYTGDLQALSNLNLLTELILIGCYKLTGA